MQKSGCIGMFFFTINTYLAVQTKYYKKKTVNRKKIKGLSICSKYLYLNFMFFSSLAQRFSWKKYFHSMENISNVNVCLDNKKENNIFLRVMKIKLHSNLCYSIPYIFVFCCCFVWFCLFVSDCMPMASITKYMNMYADEERENNQISKFSLRFMFFIAKQEKLT